MAHADVDAKTCNPKIVLKGAKKVSDIPGLHQVDGKIQAKKGFRFETRKRKGGTYGVLLSEKREFRSVVVATVECSCSLSGGSCLFESVGNYAYCMGANGCTDLDCPMQIEYPEEAQMLDFSTQ